MDETLSEGVKGSVPKKEVRGYVRSLHEQSDITLPDKPKERRVPDTRRTSDLGK